MSIVVTGATGKIGNLIVEALLARGVESNEVVAAGRNAEGLSRYGARGLRTATVDFDEPTTLGRAFEGATQLVLVSVPGNPKRVAQHRNAIEAARGAGVDLIVYTSWVHSDANDLHPEHVATEEVLRECGVPHVVLRNGPYFEHHTSWIPLWRRLGRIEGAAGEGKISGAARADLAEAVAVVLTSEGHEGAFYELGTDEPFTMADMAAELSRQSGEQIPYVNLSVEDYIARLVDAGLSDAISAHLAKFDAIIDSGDCCIDTGDLARLVGRPLVTLSQAVADALSRPASDPSLPPDRPPEGKAR